MATPNLTTFPMPTNAGPKPVIKAGGVAASDALAAAGTQINTGSLGYILGSNPGAIEGKTVYGIFRFNADSSSGALLSELKDSVSLKLSFDGISDLDWVPGTFKVAAIDSSGKIIADIPSNYTDDTYSSTTGMNETLSNGWAQVNAADAAATTGMLYLKDMTPFNPFTGTGVYGLVLSVQTKTDALVESGEFVKFKIEQGTASGTAFTQSNYTEATIKINDNVGGTNNAGVNVGINGNFDVSNPTPYINHVHSTAVNGTADVVDTFNIQKVSVTAGEYSQSDWNTKPGSANTGLGYSVIGSFGREDVLKIDFQDFKPGLSITTVDATSAGIMNEAYLLNTIRAIDGYTVNNSGIYLFEVRDSKQWTNIATPASAADPDTGFSTWVYVDSNQNGKVDSMTGDANDAVNGNDLMIRLSGVAVADIQSTNFSFVI